MGRTLHFGILDGRPSAARTLPDGFASEGDSWEIWGDPAARPRGDRTLHVTCDARIGVEAGAELLRRHLLAGEMLDAAVVESDADEWSAGQVVNRL